MQKLLSGALADYAQLANVIWGVSVEDQTYGLPRLEALRQTDVAWRFLSVEPLLEDLGELDLRGIHWCIVGGESGSGARPMAKGWVESILNQCREQKVPFFFKQWGGRNKKAAGRLLNEKTYDEYPALPHTANIPKREARALMSKSFIKEDDLTDCEAA